MGTEDDRLGLDDLRHAREIVDAGERDIIILDEVNIVLVFGLRELEDILSPVESQPQLVQLVLTGRRAHPELVLRTDQVTEMLNIKPPYDTHNPARQGLEF